MLRIEREEKRKRGGEGVEEGDLLVLGSPGEHQRRVDSCQCNRDAMRYISPPVFCHNSTLKVIAALIGGGD